jgi:pimeloyl-ACP methyl ester carboxylesterase
MAPRELRLRANGLDFFALEEGPRDGPPVLLLHGFPELSRSWRHQLPALGAAGWRAVAPDLRGYGQSGQDGPYDLRTLARDVRDLVRALGQERAVICGHDWGGAVAFGAAVYHPEVVERLVVMNCPHPGVMAEELAGNPRQLRRSLYMFFFQLPWIPEWTLTRNGAAQVARALRGGSAVRQAWPRQETDHYRRAFLQPGAARAALGYYRAAFRSWRAARRDGRASPIAAPTLVVWGALDRFLGRETVDPAKMAPYFAAGNAPAVRFLEEAGHFVQNEAPERVNAILLEWLGTPAPQPTGRTA